MKIPKKRIWILAVLLFVIVALTVLLLRLNQKAEPVVSAFLTAVYTVEDPAALRALYDEDARQALEQWEWEGETSGIMVSDNAGPVYDHYVSRYARYCTKEGFERMLANRAFFGYEKAAMEQNWKLSVGAPTLDPHTPNQFGYTIDVTVTNITTGEQKTVPQIGIILVKRTLLGYKIQGIRMQSTHLINPHPKVF